MHRVYPERSDKWSDKSVVHGLTKLEERVFLAAITALYVAMSVSLSVGLQRVSTIFQKFKADKCIERDI